MKRKVIICFFILLLFGMGGWFGMYWADSGVFVKLLMVETKGEAPLLPLGELQKIIISREDHVNMRAQAIFSIFTKYVHVGMGRTDFNVVLPGKGWVDFSDVSMGSIDGGVPEVDCQSGCAQFELRLYSRLQANWWKIYLCLEGKDLPGDEVENTAGAVNFLKGAGETRFTRIQNFTLHYPSLTGGGSGRRESYFWWGRIDQRPKF